MKEMKRIRRVFFAWQELEEEKWLKSMAAQGWHLRKVGWCVYDFIKGEPEDITYRLYSYSGKEMDLQSCVRLFEDLGWEWVGRLFSWQYFRKPHKEGEQDEILSDNQSKWEALKRWRNITLILGLMNLFNFINITLLNEGLSRSTSVPTVMIRILIAVVTGLLGYGAYRIQQRMNELKDSIL